MSCVSTNEVLLTDPAGVNCLGTDVDAADKLPLLFLCRTVSAKMYIYPGLGLAMQSVSKCWSVPLHTHNRHAFLRLRGLKRCLGLGLWAVGDDR